MKVIDLGDFERHITIELTNHELNEIVAAYGMSTISERMDMYKEYNLVRNPVRVDDNSLYIGLFNASDFRDRERK